MQSPAHEYYDTMQAYHNQQVNVPGRWIQRKLLKNTYSYFATRRNNSRNLRV
jgi:hypothetical protein